MGPAAQPLVHTTAEEVSDLMAESCSPGSAPDCSRHTEPRDEEAEPVHRGALGPARSLCIEPYLKTFCIYGRFYSYDSVSAVSGRKRPFWFDVMCGSFTPRRRYGGYQIQPDGARAWTESEMTVGFHRKRGGGVRSASCGGGFSTMRARASSSAAGLKSREVT